MPSASTAATVTEPPQEERASTRDREPARMRRAGRSTSAWVTTASASESAIASTVAATPMRPSGGAQRAVRAKTRHGQCHRYHAYEIRPR